MDRSIYTETAKLINSVDDINNINVGMKEQILKSYLSELLFIYGPVVFLSGKEQVMYSMWVENPSKALTEILFDWKVSELQLLRSVTAQKLRVA